MKKLLILLTLFSVTNSFCQFGLPSLTVGSNANRSILAPRNTETDIITSAGEPNTVSSIVNTPTIVTNTDGIQVWSFTIREGGSDLFDVDTLPTIINSIKVSQNSGNSMNNWGDCIQSVALFNGSTNIATGVVTTNLITFTGAPLINIPDGGQATLTIRLSIQVSPNNTGGNLDGDDFVFSIAKTNVVVEPILGSGLSSFSTANSQNAKNIFEVIATKLAFTTQPTNTGINGTMSPAPVVIATDANNNKDLGFTSNIAVTSTGTTAPITNNSTALFGVSSFFNIVHTASGTGYVLTASSAGLTSATSGTFDITNNTTLLPGDLAILAVNTSINSGSSGGQDQIAFVCFQDILVGTKIYLTDNGYERISANKWGNSEGVISITRTGSTLVKGTIMVLECVNPSSGTITTGAHFKMYSCNIEDTNWMKNYETGGSGFSLNKDDQVWITQGGTWGNLTTGNHDATYNGNVLYGWSDSAWKTAPNYNSTAGSTLVPRSKCFTTNLLSSATGQCYLKFNDPVDPDFSTTTRSKLDWVALFSNPANWDPYATNALYNLGGYNYKGNATCPAVTIAGSPYANGVWTGKTDTNWFECSNWQTLTVPDATTNVVFDSAATQKAVIVSTATDANFFNGIAKCKNLTLSKEKIEIKGSVNNKLEVYGDLTITNTAPLPTLDMSDGTPAPDGNLYLYGNWNNLATETQFIEGDGTVSFLGAGAQVINAVAPIGTESFGNVILGNNFDTSVSNNLLATGNLDLNSSKTLTITDDAYVSVNKKFTNNGTLNVSNTGSFIQTEDGFINIGTNNNITKTTTPYEIYDYTFWSSPVTSSTIGSPFAAWRLDHAYRFQTSNYFDIFNGNSYPQTTGMSDSFDDDGDDWQPVTSTATMTTGVGYAIMAPTSVSFATPPTATVLFSGAMNNGVLPTSVLLEQSLNTTATDDDFNLVGNPYPSAINADDFIRANTLPLAAINKISGTLYFWSHKDDIQPFTTNPGPLGYNFTSNDYATYTLLGGVGTSSSATGSSRPNGSIASGQGFFVESEAPSGTALSFNNTMRGRANLNNQFYRTNTQKDRIWLNLENTDAMFSQQLIGYVPESTLNYDNSIDGQVADAKNYLSFYSLINNDVSKKYKIQGRSTFDLNDQVPLGYFSAVSGTTTISIDDSEGVFINTDNDIFLQDNLLNITHDLKQAPYTFSTDYGTFNNRFILKYLNNSLSNNTVVNEQNSLLIAVDKRNINILSTQEKIKSIQIFDIIGRNIYNNNNINDLTFSVNELNVKNQAVICKITLENGVITTKKIIL